MSDLETDPLSQLITLLTEVLSEVRQGRLIVLERMADEFEPLYEALHQQGSESLDEGVQKNRLKTLNRLRAHLAQELEQVRSTTMTQLGSVVQGQRGLKAYRAIVTDPNRGAKRGEG